MKFLPTTPSRFDATEPSPCTARRALSLWSHVQWIIGIFVCKMDLVFLQPANSVQRKGDLSSHFPNTLSFPRIVKGHQCPPLGFGCAAGEACQNLPPSRRSPRRSHRASPQRRTPLVSRARPRGSATSITCAGECPSVGVCQATYSTSVMDVPSHR